MSLTWYTWLEQGRDIRPTPQVLDALSRALCLDEAEHRYLRRLAGHPVTGTVGPHEHVDAGLLRLLDDLLPAPASLMDTAADLLAWNRTYAKFFPDPDQLPPERRNGLIIMLLGIPPSTLRDWERHCEATIAAFRAEAGKDPANPRIRAIINLLMTESDFFRQAWSRHQVQRFVEHEELYTHPVIGQVRTEQLLLRPLGEPSLILVLHRPIDAQSRERLGQLLV